MWGLAVCILAAYPTRAIGDVHVMAHWLSPGDPGQRTGGYRYNARVVQGLRDLGHEVVVHELVGAWPEPTARELVSLREQLARLPAGAVVADGLLWPAIAGMVSRPVTVLVHSPLWRENGPAWRVREERALARAHRVVCTSHRIAWDLTLAQAPEVVPPGVDRAPPAARPGSGALLCVATVTPRKGHDVLLAALERVSAPWTLTCAGSLTRARAWAHTLTARTSGRVRWVGELDDVALSQAYQGSDVLVHSAHYEGWGMAIADALVRGLPVISTPAGALDGQPEGPWEVVPPGDPASMARAIQAHLTHPPPMVRPFWASVPWAEVAQRFEGLLRAGG